jgi:hypothetical protein
MFLERNISDVSNVSGSAKTVKREKNNTSSFKSMCIVSLTLFSYFSIQDSFSFCSLVQCMFWDSDQASLFCFFFSNFVI